MSDTGMPRGRAARLRFWARSVVFSSYGGNPHPNRHLLFALVVEGVFRRVDAMRAKKGDRHV